MIRLGVTSVCLLVAYLPHRAREATRRRRNFIAFLQLPRARVLCGADRLRLLYLPAMPDPSAAKGKSSSLSISGPPSQPGTGSRDKYRTSYCIYISNFRSLFFCALHPQY